MRRFKVLTAVAVFGLLGQSMRAATPTVKCPDSGLIVASCFLDHSHFDPITIARDNVTLDCRGHQVASTVPGDMRDGILVDSRSNVGIVNCNVIGWNNGIRIDNTTSVRLTDNVVSKNDDGIDINSSKSIYITGGVAMFNTGDGIDLDDDDFVSISQVSIVHNGDKAITANTKTTVGNTRIYAIENRISDNGTGIRLESVSRGMVCGNGFARNAGGNVVRKVGVTRVDESDNNLNGRFGVCPVD
jgi:parallel beta-helix repeat protein